MTLDEDRLRAGAAEYVDDPTLLDSFVESVRRRLAWRIEHGHKVCSKCGEAKKPSEFTMNSSRRDGLHDACRACEQKRNQARRVKP